MMICVSLPGGGIVFSIISLVMNPAVASLARRAVERVVGAKLCRPYRSARDLERSRQRISFSV